MTEIYKKERTQLDDDLRRNATRQSETAVDREAMAEKHMPKVLLALVSEVMHDLQAPKIQLILHHRESTIEWIQDYLDAVVKAGLQLRKLASQAADARQHILDDLGE